MKNIMVWFNGKFETVNIGQKFLVATSGSGKTYLGEFATLKKATKQHLVFEAESGMVIKTKIDNLHEVIGKAGKQGVFVTPRIEGRENDENFIKNPIILY